jgi:FkbM family methyltransferase
LITYNMRKAISSLVPLGVKKKLFHLRSKFLDVYAIRSYSQEGEDMILRRIFDGRPHGFYVDVGAHHPRRFSNTFFFYRRGWSGINIEPNPDGMREFRAERTRDINLQLGVSDRPGKLTYYLFDEPALNTFDGELVAQRLDTTPYKVIAKQEIAVERLDAILGQYMTVERKISFLTVDVEGLDLSVLMSNDWDRFRPECVLAEALSTSLETAMQGDLCAFMQDRQYELFAKTYNTLVFRDKQLQAGSGEKGAERP